jgi:hypothetical protein
MLRSLIGALGATAMLVAGTMVLAQGVNTAVTTPPMHASDTFFLPIDIHNLAGTQPPWAGWAGGRMAMHVLDAGEMDVLGLQAVAAGAFSRGPGGIGTPTGPFLPNPFGPASNNSQSVVKFFTALHPAAQASGINITGSVNQPLFDLNIHVKNSDPVGNGDVDASFKFWNIWHVREHQGSTTVHLNPSDYVFVPPNITSQQQLHFPEGSFYLFPSNPVSLATGHWLHLSDPANFHLAGGPGSTFYATFLNTATLGIEHVPEPTGVVLLASGLMCGVIGTCIRRWRKKSAA